MNEFINIVKEERISDKEAYDEIIDKLIVKNLKGSDKLTDLESYDSETVFDKLIYCGNVYVFSYKAKTRSLYSYNGKNIYYTDNMPIVLITSMSSTCIRGINLNLCNHGLKTIILNLIQNIDPYFYNGNAQHLAELNKLALSNNVLTFLNMQDSEQQIIAYLKKLYESADYSSLFRNYNVNCIQQIRLVEPWQWKFLPFLTYRGDMKMETLKAIHTISGYDQIKI